MSDHPTYHVTHVVHLAEHDTAHVAVLLGTVDGGLLEFVIPIVEAGRVSSLISSGTLRVQMDQRRRKRGAQ